MFLFTVMADLTQCDPYYKSKLEWRLSEVFPVNCKFICVHIFESQT